MYKKEIDKFIEDIRLHREYINTTSKFLSNDFNSYIKENNKEWLFMNCFFLLSSLSEDKISSEERKFKKKELKRKLNEFEELFGEKIQIIKNSIVPPTGFNKYSVYKKFTNSVEKKMLLQKHYDISFVKVVSIVECFFRDCIVEFIRSDKLNFKENQKISISDIHNFESLKEIEDFYI